jgi:hypothetical protein
MPRDAHSDEKAVDLLDLLIEFFDDGERWIKGKIDDGAGNRCLVGALRYIRDGHNLHGALTRLYLLKAMQRSPKTGWTGLISFNDRCRDFGELREVILQARKLAVADIERHRRGGRTSELLAA